MVVTEEVRIEVRCALCGAQDFVSPRRNAREYEELRQGMTVHHICRQCQQVLRARAIHDRTSQT